LVDRVHVYLDHKDYELRIIKKSPSRYRLWPAPNSSESQEEACVDTELGGVPGRGRDDVHSRPSHSMCPSTGSQRHTEVHHRSQSPLVPSQLPQWARIGNL